MMVVLMRQVLQSNQTSHHDPPRWILNCLYTGCLFRHWYIMTKHRFRRLAVRQNHPDMMKGRWNRRFKRLWINCIFKTSQTPAVIPAFPEKCGGVCKSSIWTDIFVSLHLKPRHSLKDDRHDTYRQTDWVLKETFCFEKQTEGWMGVLWALCTAQYMFACQLRRFCSFHPAAFELSWLVSMD